MFKKISKPRLARIAMRTFFDTGMLALMIWLSIETDDATRVIVSVLALMFLCFAMAGVVELVVYLTNPDLVRK